MGMMVRAKDECGAIRKDGRPSGLLSAKPYIT